jgi:hypothetical protein
MHLKKAIEKGIPSPKKYQIICFNAEHPTDAF